jgi:hypothetical protein
VDVRAVGEVGALDGPVPNLLLRLLLSSEIKLNCGNSAAPNFAKGVAVLVAMAVCARLLSSEPENCVCGLVSERLGKGDRGFAVVLVKEVIPFKSCLSVVSRSVLGLLNVCGENIPVVGAVCAFVKEAPLPPEVLSLIFITSEEDISVCGLTKCSKKMFVQMDACSQHALKKDVL